MLQSGLPVDRFDAMVLDGSITSTKKSQLYSRLIKRYSGMCTGPILVNQTSTDEFSIMEDMEDKIICNENQLTELLLPILNH